ncbi:MAG: MBL fold metallo-hydrolase [Acidimicrobiales bacterium]
MNEPSAELSAEPTVITWVGHSTILIDAGGFRILTDPLLTKRVAHLRRRRPVPFLGDIAPVDVVLISHVHMDHLHRPSLKRMKGAPQLVCPVGAEPLLKNLGFEQLSSVDPGDELDIDPARVSVTFADHKGGRGPHSRVATNPVGYVIEVGGHRLYFPGDTDIFDGMAELAPIDVAFLPIWGWGPSIGTGHLNPERAVEAAGLLQADRVVPIHWGTYSPENGRGTPTWLNQPPSEFVRAMDIADSDFKLCLIEPGGQIELN